MGVSGVLFVYVNGKLKRILKKDVFIVHLKKGDIVDFVTTCADGDEHSETDVEMSGHHQIGLADDGSAYMHLIGGY